MAGIGTAVLAQVLPAMAAPGPLACALRAKADSLPLRPGGSRNPVWSLGDGDIRFRRGDVPEIVFGNGLPIPAVLNWRGIDGASAAEPLLARTSVVPGATDTFRVALRHAGTYLCDLALLGDGAAQPSRGLPVIVDESEPVAVDRDVVFLIEDWRLRVDGTAIAPGIDPKGTTSVYTVNGLTTLEVAARAHERLRFRFINGCQRNVVAIKIERHEAQVMALDGQPSEPFLARNGALVLAPGGRADTFIDAGAAPVSTASILLHDGKEARPIGRLVASTEPPIRDEAMTAASALPSNGLPAQLDLRNALRFDLSLGGPQADWMPPPDFVASSPPAFRAKTGRTVVLALTNRAEIATVFHLHGHHFRLLDRLDDGWKPFWLDTLAIDAGQTQRIVFAAEKSGRWLLEATATDWAAPRLIKWYMVE